MANMDATTGAFTDNDFAFDAPTGGDIFDTNADDNADDWFGEWALDSPAVMELSSYHCGDTHLDAKTLCKKHPLNLPERVAKNNHLLEWRT